MVMMLHIAAFAMDTAAVAVLLYWAVGLGRVLSSMVKVPTLRAGLPLARAKPSTSRVCIIVPAHNEEGAIAELVHSLKVQSLSNLSFVLSLDRCDDRTRERALAAVDGDRRFSILDITSCPTGWAGKVNAAWQGAGSAPARAADLLLFIDADTVLDPECIAAATSLMESRGLELLSLLSTLSSRRWFELVVQPAAGMELVRQYPIVRANRAVRRRAFANGQFMLFTREAYDAVGGHQGVKDELLEDLALARAIARAHRPAGLFLADGLLACRMYDSYAAFRAGWKRIYTESTHRKVGRLRQAAVANAVMSSALPMLTLTNLVFSACLLGRPEGLHNLGVASLAISGSALALWLLVVGASYRLGRVPLWTLPGFAVGSWLVGWILIEAARDLRRGAVTSWGGRSYIRTPR